MVKIKLTELPNLQEEEGVIFCPKCGCSELCWNEKLEFHNICCECGTVIEVLLKNK